MKKISSLFVLFALAFSFMVATAQEQPKKDEAKVEKMECAKKGETSGCCTSKKMKAKSKKGCCSMKTNCDMKKCSDDSKAAKSPGTN